MLTEFLRSGPENEVASGVEAWSSSAREANPNLRRIGVWGNVKVVL